jgi:hypothetical protein
MTEKLTEIDNQECFCGDCFFCRDGLEYSFLCTKILKSFEEDCYSSISCNLFLSYQNIYDKVIGGESNG